CRHRPSRRLGRGRGGHRGRGRSQDPRRTVHHHHNSYHLGVSMSSRTLRAFTVAAVALLTAGTLTACGGGDDAAASGGGEGATLRLGSFPNITHAPALVGVKDGLFQNALGGTKLEAKTFNAGPAAIEALFSGAIDATYIGPN